MENPWQLLPARPPFVLADDEAEVRRFNEHAAARHRLRVEAILPEPFVGDPDAPVLVLGNNPGVTDAGLVRRSEPRFRARMRANLLHQPSDWPFVFFDPNVDHGNRTWWEVKLQGLLHFKHEHLSRTILAVEHFPYPSEEYPRGRLRLRSAAQQYSFELVRRAIEREAIIVVTRGMRRWLRDVPALDRYHGLCELRNKQKGGITSGNCDRFAEVERAIERVL